jgi:Transmembrane amino acid transporter protein
MVRIHDWSNERVNIFFNTIYCRTQPVPYYLFPLCLIVHTYTAPRFYWELKDNTMARYNQVVLYSFTGAIVIMAVTATAGFATFGAASDALILNNYSLTDSWMSLSRLAVTVSLLFSYPLAFSGLRQGFLDLFADSILARTANTANTGSNSRTLTVEQRRQSLFTPVTIGLLTLITSMAFVVKDIRILLALSGATWGNCVIYLFPSLMMIKTILATSSSSRSSSKSASSGRVMIAGMSTSTLSSISLPLTTGIVGLILGAIGTTRAIQTLLA